MSESEAWKPGKDFEVLEVLAPSPLPTGPTSCLQMRIWRDGTVLDLFAQPFEANSSPGWAVLTALPQHPSLVPVLHSFVAEEPVLDRGRPPCARRQCLFLALPVEGIPVPKFLRKHQALYPSAPFGLSWRWVAQLLQGMLRALQWLQHQHVVHGALLPDHFLLPDSPQTQLQPHVQVTGFAAAWVSLRQGKHRAWSMPTDVDEAPVGGRGTFQAPEVHRAHAALVNRTAFCITPFEVLPKAELWTVGRCMYDLLCPKGPPTIFDKLPSLKDFTYPQEALPALPTGTPPWLVHLLRGLVRSDDRLRLDLPDALQMLEMGLAMPERVVLSVVEKQVKIPVLVDRVVEKVVETPVYVDRIVEKLVERVVEKVVEVPQPSTITSSPIEPLVMQQPKMEKIIEVQEVQKIVEVEKPVPVPYILEIVTRPAAQGEAPGRYLSPHEPGPSPACPVACRTLLASYPPSHRYPSRCASATATASASGGPVEFTPPCSPQTAHMRSPPRPAYLNRSPTRSSGYLTGGTSPSRQTSTEEPSSAPRRQVKLKKGSRAPSQDRPVVLNGNSSFSREKRGMGGTLTTLTTESSLTSSARGSRKSSTDRATPRATPVIKAGRPGQKDLTPPSTYTLSAGEVPSPRTASPRLNNRSPRESRSVLLGGTDRSSPELTLPYSRFREDSRRTLWCSGVAVPMDVDHLEGRGSPAIPSAASSGPTAADTGESARVHHLSRYLDSYFEKGRAGQPKDGGVGEEVRRRASPLTIPSPTSRTTRSPSKTLQRHPEERLARPLPRSPMGPACTANALKRNDSRRPGEGAPRRRGTSPEKMP